MEMTKRGFLKSLMAGSLAGIPAVKAVEHLEYKSGDTFLITFPDDIPMEAAVRIKELWQKYLPGSHALVIGSDPTVRIIKES